jgi:hypothetical protein
VLTFQCDFEHDVAVEARLVDVKSAYEIPQGFQSGDHQILKANSKFV